MKRIALVLVITLASILLWDCLYAGGQVEESAKRKGSRAGVSLSKENLVEIRKEHIKWLESDGIEGKRAELSKADLSEADLRKADLSGADLSNTDLSEAQLNESILRGADLSGAYLREANLIGADLSGANLSNSADLSGANLTKASLRDANLIGSVLGNADLSEADLSGADLSKADLGNAILVKTILRDAKLNEAFLFDANLSKADLSGAILSEAELIDADLIETILSDAKLIKTKLNDADLSNAKLLNADLTEADLTGANLSGANLKGVNLSGVIFEPRPGTLPDVATLATARNVSSLKFESPIALSELREAFKKGGFRRLEREITFILERSKTREARRRGGLGKIEGAFRFIMFEFTCEYGRSPGRPLLILGTLIFIFSLLYMMILRITNGRAGIWAVWPKDRIFEDEGKNGKPIRVTCEFMFPNLQQKSAGKRWGLLLQRLCVPLMGLYFSILSTFQIGWRELNVGNWIARMQPREYTLRATGWVRLVSGVQSLISVYLAALWVLTYFGRPFE